MSKAKEAETAPAEPEVATVPPLSEPVPPPELPAVSQAFGKGPFKVFGPLQRFYFRINLVPELEKHLVLNRRDALQVFSETPDSVFLAVVNEVALAKGGEAAAIGDGYWREFFKENWYEILSLILSFWGIVLPPKPTPPKP